MPLNSSRRGPQVSRAVAPDRAAWAECISFTAYGVCVCIRVNRRGVLPRLLECLPPGWKPAEASGAERTYSVVIGDLNPSPNGCPQNVLYGGSEEITRSVDAKEVIERLESDLQLYTAEWARQKLFIHAGAVGWGGRAIIMPGRSFAGKTTLVAELVRAGAVYYSDEYAVIDAAGLVHPYPKPLAIRKGGSTRQTKYSVGELGGQIGDGPLPVAMVMISNFRPGANWRPRELTAGQAVLELLANTVAARRQPEVALSRLKQVVLRAACLKGARGESEEVVSYISRYFSV